MVIGFAAQESIAVATLIFGGVLDRHPELDIWISHGGGGIPMLAARLAQAARKRPWATESIKKDGAFEEALTHFWYDAHVTAPSALSLLQTWAGNDRIVYGTNFAGWDQPEHGGHGDIDPLWADNARRLLRKD